jgi:hypothetical protein
MNQSKKDKFLKITDGLIEEAKSVSSSQFESHYLRKTKYVDPQEFHKWWGKIKSLGHQLGVAAKPWQELFSSNPDNSLASVKVILGTLQAIKHELENDYLQNITQLVKAETLADLLDQGEHLFDGGYYLAAGVIGRAVLEEHLRTTCLYLNCSSNKKRPTINDYNQALYGIQHYSKVKMKQIDTLAAIGNDAAHNKKGIDTSDIKKMLTDLPEIIDSTGV